MQIWNHFWFSSQASEHELNKFNAISQYLGPNMTNIVIHYEDNFLKIQIEMSRIFHATKWNAGSLCTQNTDYISAFKKDIKKLFISFEDTQMIPKVVAALPQFIKLKYLEITLKQPIEAISFKSLSDYLKRCKISITLLNIRNYKDNDSLNRILRSLQPHFFKLRHLTFSECCVDDKTLVNVVTNIPSLRIFTLKGNKSFMITNQSFDKICSSDLMELNFLQVNFRILNSQALRLSSLRRLTLQPDTSYSSEIVPLSCISKMQHLQRLDITCFPIPIDHFSELKAFTLQRSLQSITLGGFKIYYKDGRIPEDNPFGKYLNQLSIKVHLVALEWIYIPNMLWAGKRPI